jgi:DNA modification methylase
MRLFEGNCLDVLKELPDNSVDSIVTDPPYGLSFMGKKWDYDVPSVEVWRECLRVLKHGGHLLAFAGSRTYHRLVVNVEDAGFEIRDQIMWVYGSGFPKSLNISKAIDKAAGAKREVIGQNKNARGTRSDKYNTGRGFGVNPHLTASKTPEAQQWEGWGTALKPAHEPIVVARKPPIGTIAENVLEHGTGGLNIDGCRIGTDIVGWGGGGRNGDTATAGASRGGEQGGYNYDAGEARPVKGRFPANFIHDGSDEVLAGFPTSKSAKGITVSSPTALGQGTGWNAHNNRPVEFENYGDEGSAARFFKKVSFSKHEHEPIVLARKPLEGTVVENVLEHGTGGLNIDGCRIETSDNLASNGTTKAFSGSNNNREGTERITYESNPLGRFPANLIHDGSDEVVSAFPQTKSTTRPPSANADTGNGLTHGKMKGIATERGFNDEGSAARFFYCAKASKSERNAGLEAFEDKKSQHNAGGIGRKVSVEKRLEQGKENAPMMKNIHPTVKPVDLMKYLCRLVTPPEGVVLDPFMGSGTTGIAAKVEGFDFIGIEMDAEYLAIAEARIGHWVEEVETTYKTLHDWL